MTIIWIKERKKNNKPEGSWQKEKNETSNPSLLFKFIFTIKFVNHVRF